MAKYLDENGLLYFWQQIKTKFAGFAFSKVRITNGTTNTDLEADTIADMLTITNGTDITLTPTANTDTVAISHSNSGVTAASKGDTSNQTPGFGGTFKVTSGTVNARGHLTAFADHTVTIPSATATSSAAGLMSASDKSRLDGLDGEYIELPDSPSSGDYLKYNGTAWVADQIPAGAAPTSTSPKMDGTAAVGTENAFARGDHVHPTDTSRQAKITASGILKGNGSGTVSAATAGTDYQAPITFDGTYNASTNKAATVSTVTNAIGGLDGSITGTPGNTKTLTAFSQTDGVVTATFGDISFPEESVFVATYGTTTYNEITAALNADKAVFAYSATSKTLVPLVGSPSTSSVTNHRFCITTSANETLVWTVDTSDTWSATTTVLAKTASPTFTGTPKAPTATTGDSSTQIATTAFVATAISNAPQGTVTKVTAGAGLNTTSNDTATDGGDITSTGTLYLTKSGVTAGTYQGITVDKYGRVTSASDQGYTTNTGTVTSVRVQATSPVQSSTSTAQSTSLNTTISLANGYGDTKNPYAAKSPHYVLAGPSSGSSTAEPTFRALVADDIPSITVSKISDFPDLANIYKYKGSVAAYADLPSTGLTAGDVYDVQSDGMNYAWTGTAWDALGMSFSITSISNAEIDAILLQ